MSSTRSIDCLLTPTAGPKLPSSGPTHTPNAAKSYCSPAIRPAAMQGATADHPLLFRPHRKGACKLSRLERRCMQCNFSRVYYRLLFCQNQTVIALVVHLVLAKMRSKGGASRAAASGGTLRRSPHVLLQSTGVEFPEVTTFWDGDKMRSVGAGVRAKKFAFVPVKVSLPEHSTASLALLPACLACTGSLWKKGTCSSCSDCQEAEFWPS